MNLPSLEKVRKCFIYTLLVIAFTSSVCLNIGRKGLHCKSRSVNTSGHVFYRQYLFSIHYRQPLSNTMNSHVAIFFNWNIFMFYANLKLLDVFKKNGKSSVMALSGLKPLYCSFMVLNEPFDLCSCSAFGGTQKQTVTCRWASLLFW